MRSRRVWASVFCLCLLAPCTHASAQQTPASQTFSQVTAATPLPNGIELRDGTLILRITALQQDVLRIRAGQGSLPEDASWAVLPEARTASVSVQPDSTADSIGFRTATLRVAIDRATGLLSLYDLNGNLLENDAEPMQFDASGFRITRSIPSDEHYFGLGDKTGSFDRLGASFRMWNTDAYAWQESTDPLYKSIPFYLTYRAGTSLGVLIDNTWPASFDFGHALPTQLQYRADGGSPDIYILYGPSAKHVLERYAWLTGPTPLPPLWALGFQQSRYSYPTQARVLEVANRLRADKIPSDAIYLDIDYQDHNRPFTVDTKAFPDFPGMVSTLHQQGFHVVAITDLHIAKLPGQNYAPFDCGVTAHSFLTNPDGTLFVGKVWPGPSVFPDFTQQKTRAWWGTLYTEFTHAGIDGFWNDMNEPSVFNSLKTMPDNVVHHIDEPGFLPRTATHREIHNVYGMENSRATWDGQLTLRPDTRPFVLTRASYAGGQRYAATWTGDNSATWNHLRLTTPMLKNIGLSGFSLAGADVGGYAGTPTAELLTRWIELAAFQPIDRDHAEKGTGDHEVWANGPEQESIRRHFIETRYQLLPYLYTVMEQNTHTGLPLLRPLFLEFPDAAPDHHPIDIDLDTSGEFLVGPDLLVAAPPFFDKAGDYDAKLPTTGWYNFWTGAKLPETPKPTPAPGQQPEAASGPAIDSVHIHPDLASLPVFVRPGAILPIAPLVQSTQDRPQGPLTVRVFPGPNCTGSLYQDDGSTLAYQRGDFLRITFSCEVSADHISIHIGPHQGPYAAWWRSIDVQVDGLPEPPTSAVLNGRPTPFRTADHSITLTTQDNGKGIDILLDLPR